MSTMELYVVLAEDIETGIPEIDEPDWKSRKPTLYAEPGDAIELYRAVSMEEGIKALQACFVDPIPKDSSFYGYQRMNFFGRIENGVISDLFLDHEDEAASLLKRPIWDAGLRQRSRRRSKVTEEVRNRVIGHFSDGLPAKQIAHIENLHMNTVYKIQKGL